MNENRVLKVEKRATDKVGLIVLIVFVLAALGFGAYYVIKNKEKLNIYLPWEKNDDNDTREVKGLKSNKDEEFVRTETTFDVPSVINDNIYLDAKLDSVKYENGDYKFNITITNNDFANYEIEINDILIDSFSTRISDKISVSFASNVSYEFTITKELLDRYRIDTFEYVYLDVNVKGLDNTLREIWKISSNNLTASFPKTIQEVLEIEGIKFYYFKAAESKDNYFIYLLLDNTSDKNINYYYSKFVLDNKEFDASSYAAIIYSGTKYVETIKIPKKDFRSIKKLSLRVMTIINNDITISKDVKVTL